MEKAKQTKQVEKETAENMEDQASSEAPVVQEVPIVVRQKEPPQRLVAKPLTDPKRYGGLLSTPSLPATVVVETEEQPEEFKSNRLERRLFTSESRADRFARAALGR